MPQFETVEKTDPRFLELLRGDFSEKERAIPLTTLLTSTGKEKVTFKILPVGDVATPSVWVVLSRVLRLPLQVLVLGPALVTLAYLKTIGQAVSLPDAALAIGSLSSFLAAVSALNDYFDHLGGSDRQGFGGGTRVIQQGWLSAKEVRDIGYGFLLLAGILGLKALLTQPFFLALVSLVAVASVVGFSFGGRGLRSLGLGELVIFFALGSFTTYGVARAAAGYHDINIICLGSLFGVWSAILWQLKNLQRIYLDRYAVPGTLIARLGFNRAKRLIQLEMCLALILALILGVRLALNAWNVPETALAIFPQKILSLYGMVFLTLPLVATVFGIKILRALGRTSSPVSSKHGSLTQLVFLGHLDLSLILLLACGSFWLWN